MFKTDMFVSKGGSLKVEYLKQINPSLDNKLKTRIGQVGGLDTDVNGDLLIFHRGDREWDYKYLLTKEINFNF